MKKALSVILAFSILISTGILTVFAEESPEGAVVQDNLVTTTHKTVIQGKTVNYTATAGTMAVESGGGQCEIFFIAYTRDGVQDLSKRPITFAFNGGPGAASLYINFLCLGPKRMELDELGHAPALPAALVYNGNSLLDLTDLVFIDAVGTGYSRAVSEEDQFIGYTNDIRTIGDFIRLYVNRNGRWGSPKYLAGESYGTTRAVGLCEYLSDTYSMGLNGLMLISTVNDFSEVFPTPGNELPYALYLPTYAADAWYHGCLEERYQSTVLEEFLDEVRDFVSNEYVPALFKGRSLSDERQEELAKKIASYTGLKKEYLLKANLRVESESFFEELLSEQKLMIGRYDGRFTGPLTSGSNDPSEFDLDQSLIAAANRCITDELKYQTDTPYIPLSLDINSRWDYNCNNSFLAQEETIYNCMSANSFLKVWVLCGYYDGATPFYGTEWVYDHVFLDDLHRENLSFSYYPSGHMFYLDSDSFARFREEAEAWYQP